MDIDCSVKLLSAALARVHSSAPSSQMRIDSVGTPEMRRRLKLCCFFFFFFFLHVTNICRRDRFVLGANRNRLTRTSCPPAGLLPSGDVVPAGGAARRSDQEEHLAVPGGLQRLPGQTRLQEEEGKMAAVVMATEVGRGWSRGVLQLSSLTSGAARSEAA